MKVMLSNVWHMVLRFDKGEEVIGAVEGVAAQENINAAWLSAIGSAGKAELGFYDLAEKKYINKEFTGEFELLEASGTVALLDGNPKIHLHGVLGNKEFQTFGGHIHTLIAHATIEVFIHKIEGELRRSQDSKTGLNLLS